MTLTELIEAAQRQVWTYSEFTWQCFGPGAWAVILGQDNLHTGTAVTIDVRVVAVDLASLGWWVDPEYRTAFLLELELQDQSMQGPELGETELLLTLYNSLI
jgi:hypothetical protein